MSRADARELEEPAIAESEPKDQGAGGGSLENSAGSESQEPAQGDSEGGVDIADDTAVLDSMTSAEQDASAIEGAEVLQQGDGEKSGNVLLADRAAVEALGGRDFAGQAVKEINGTTYILIGNEQQLRAIGSDKKVISGQVWSIEQHWVDDGLLKGHWEDTEGTNQLVYAGDADLETESTLHDGTFKDHEGGVVGNTRTKFYTIDAKGRNDDVKTVETGLKYAIDANYLIFRDIDLGANADDPTNTGWTPLMFSSTMLGAKSDTPDKAGSLWNCIGADGKSITDVTAVANPVISNVNVVQSGRLSVGKQMGVGFFGTISADHDDNDVFARPSAATVSNITLKGVTVDNGFTEAYVDQTLVSSLAGLLGDLVGGLLGALLSPLLELLGVPDLPGLVSNLLKIRAADPTSLATGAFAGRIVGAVNVSGCEVADVTVESLHGYVGGFAGYVQGETLYGPISELLNGLVKLLAGLLNVVPGIGLGDVITLLLDSNVIKAGQLTPINYMNPEISNCSVRNFGQNETIGLADKDYAGGFAGVMVGAIAQDCSVESTNPYTVTARLYAGGFAGLMRNDVMKGALSKAGIELLRPAQPQSIAVGCAVRSGVTVSAASYAGGFAGAMANSYAVDASVEGTVGVSATGHEELQHDVRSIKALAGGFTGAATVGWVTDLGQGENKNSDLLAGVNSLLSGLLTEDRRRHRICFHLWAWKSPSCLACR